MKGQVSHEVWEGIFEEEKQEKTIIGLGVNFIIISTLGMLPRSWIRCNCATPFSRLLSITITSNALPSFKYTHHSSRPSRSPFSYLPYKILPVVSHAMIRLVACLCHESIYSSLTVMPSLAVAWLLVLPGSDADVSDFSEFIS